MSRSCGEQLSDLQIENQNLKSRNAELHEKIHQLEFQLQDQCYTSTTPSRPLASPPSTSTALNLFPDLVNTLSKGSLVVIVVGASGDLAKKKTFPALYQLYAQGFLPANVVIMGFARSNLAQAAFHERISAAFPRLKGDSRARFLSRCEYHSGGYDSLQSFQEMMDRVEKLENENGAQLGVRNRIFYFAIPPSVFSATASSIRQVALSPNGFNRIIVEKPFGKDSASSAELSSVLLSQFQEEQLYRIDHYLGKEMVQNLMVLRFSNMVFEPLWNSHNIASVSITFKEDIGTEGRGGYFDEFGIMRDVMQNHLMQILSLVAMEQPVSLGAEDIRDEKVKVLKCIKPLTLDRLVLGQYIANDTHPGYRDDATVPDDSVTATFAQAVLYVDNPRWHGVPFILKCGKSLNERKTAIRIQYKTAPACRFPNPVPNELVLRVQPDEAIWLKLSTKSPGLGELERVQQTELNLTYKNRFVELEKTSLPDAYERLLLDVLRGDHGLFVRNDELEEAWRIFTPALHHIESERVQPEYYVRGTRGPRSADVATEALGFRHADGYSWREPGGSGKSFW